MGDIGIPEVLIALAVLVASFQIWRVWRAIPTKSITYYVVLVAVAVLIVLLYVWGTPVKLTPA